MPYITCPDSKTYSRYSSKPYVKQCIAEQKQKQQEKIQACLESPACKEQATFNGVFLFSGFLLITLCLFFLFYKLFIDTET